MVGGQQIYSLASQTSWRSQCPEQSEPLAVMFLGRYPQQQQQQQQLLSVMVRAPVMLEGDLAELEVLVMVVGVETPSPHLLVALDYLLVVQVYLEGSGTEVPPQQLVEC